MGFLKRLFGGGDDGGSNLQDKDGLYFYIRLYNVPGQPRPNDEIIQVRINKLNDISLDDENRLFVRKDVVGTRKFRRGEMLVYFDEKRNMQDFEITGGEMVSAEDYQNYLASLGESPE